MKKTMTGRIVSDRMEKTLVVLVEIKKRHPRYHKIVFKHKRYKVHNENKDLKVGDSVVIEETRPISKHKHYKVVSKA